MGGASVCWSVCLCLAALLLAGVMTSQQAAGGDYTLTVRMDRVMAEQPDDLVCIGQKLDPQESYIVQFTPHAAAATAHHMMAYGCRQPAVDDYTHEWRCGEADGRGSHSVCRDSDRQILFAWALDAPAKALPDGVGFRVSGNTGINYLVVQLHYAHRFQEGQTDNSGYTFHMTTQRPPQQAGYIVVGTWGDIPPHRPEFHMESSCEYRRNYSIYPFAYRTHSHNLGVVTSGYRVRGGRWAEIGRMSPQLPQTFYPVTHPGMDIRPGDSLAARCTMNSLARAAATPIGKTNWDEMCNFYIMYATSHQGQLVTDYCFQDANTFSWSAQFPGAALPPAASSLADIPRADTVRDKFHMKPRRALNTESGAFASFPALDK